LRHLAAVRVPDAEPEIHLRRGGRLGHQDLVTPDPEVAVRDGSCLLRRQVDVLAHSVDHDEVIAQGLHFRETYTHK